MRILIINNLYLPYVVGGGEVSVQTLADGLQRNGHDVKIISLGSMNNINASDDSVFYIDYPLMIKIWPIKDNRKFIGRLAFQYIGDITKSHVSPKIRKIIRAFKPDIVHTNNLAGIGSCVWSIISTFKIPIVHTLRDYYHLCIKQTMFNQSKRCNCAQQCSMCFLATVIRRSRSRHVAGIVGNSDHILQAHLTSGYFKHAKKYVVSGGLSESFVLNHKLPPKTISQIGYLGQIVSTKGVDDFIQLAHKYHNLKFVVGGDVSNHYAIKLKSENKLSNLSWLGRVDPQEFLDSIDILIVPSKWHEPLPRVIYEAYARGILVVATKNGGNPSVMAKLPDEYRFLYSSEDIKSLFSVFQDAIDLLSSGIFDPNVLIKNSLNFTESKIVEKYCRIYREVQDNYLLDTTSR